MKRLLTLLAALGLLVAACGDDDDTSATAETEIETEADRETGDAAPETETETVDAEDATDEDYARALAAELQSDGGFPGEPEQVECVAGVFVGSLGGAEALREVGVSPQDLADVDQAADLGVELDEEQIADDLVGGFEDCDYDLIALLTQSLGPEAPEGFEECVRAQVSNDDIADVFARLMIDPEDDQAAEALVPKLESCAPTE